jgi:ankyrin repeat protein
MKDLEGFTALQHAVMNGFVDTVRVLCERGADINTVNIQGKTLLIAAFLLKRFDVAAFLIRAGADVNAVTSDGFSALAAAARSNSVSTVQLLLEHGADIAAVDALGKNALFEAAYAGAVHMMEFLVQRGLSITAVDRTGTTLLMKAVNQRHKAAAEWLLQHGAAVNTVDHGGYTALYRASSSSCEDAAMIELLLANGADVHIRAADNSRTALDAAAIKGHLKTVKLLVAAGCDVNSADSSGMTSLHLALERHHSEVVQLLLEHGATAVINNVLPVRCPLSNTCLCAGLTALMMRATVDTVKLLLAAGADVDVTTVTGDTCLHLAVRHKLPAPVICLLVKADVDLHAVNNAGRTAAQLAHEIGCALVEQLLYQRQ